MKRYINPFSFRTILGQKHEILEYQVKQTHVGVLVSVVLFAYELDQTHTKQTEEDLKKELKTGLQVMLETKGLQNPEVSIKVVASILRRPGSSKTERFIKLTH